MSIKLTLFPYLTEEMKDKIRFQVSEYEFSYNRKGEEYKLDIEAVEGSNTIVNLTDIKGFWNMDEYGLNIKRSYSIQSYSCLYGANGIASSNAEIGLALMWTSQTSKQRGMIPIGSLPNNDNCSINLNMVYSFPVAELRGYLELTTIIYIKRAGNQRRGEEHLANTEGYVLGELDKIAVTLDGIGSEFPICEVDEPNNPLWYIDCDWEDPTYEPLSESFCIKINKGHTEYKYLDRESKKFNNQLLNEIVSNAITLLILKLKDEPYWNQIVEGENLIEGSLAEAVYYFISTFGWDVSSPEKLSLSIRSYLENN